MDVTPFTNDRLGKGFMKFHLEVLVHAFDFSYPCLDDVIVIQEVTTTSATQRVNIKEVESYVVHLSTPG